MRLVVDMRLALARRSLTLPLALLLLAAAATALQAQEAPSPDAPPPASNAPALPPSGALPAPTLQLSIRLVDAYFSVRDKNGYVLGLTPSDCQVSEDHQPQTLKALTQEKNLPLTLGILLDTSGSQQRVLPLEQQSAARFLKSVLTPKDEAFLISFDVNVDLLSDDTSSAAELTRAINQATINAASASAGLPGIGSGPFPTAHPRGTLLYDAVYLAAHDKLQSQAGRKVIVLLTDGGDQGSQETLASATEAAQKANVLVYVILLADHPYLDSFGTPISGKAQMQHLARDTGGRVIDVGNNGPKLEAAFTQIQDELRTQYLLSYTPLNQTADGKFRKLEIHCGDARTVQARKGYYALPTPNDAASF
jgi:VWFA-related protein